jgi:hypothetical protein
MEPNMKKSVLTALITLLVAVPVTAVAASSDVFRLKSQDRVIYGRVGCTATVEAQAILLCQRQPRSRARYEVVISPKSIAVFRVGNPVPIYVTP